MAAAKVPWRVDALSYLKRHAPSRQWSRKDLNWESYQRRSARQRSDWSGSLLKVHFINFIFLFSELIFDYGKKILLLVCDVKRTAPESVINCENAILNHSPGNTANLSVTISGFALSLFMRSQMSNTECVETKRFWPQENPEAAESDKSVLVRRVNGLYVKYIWAIFRPEVENIELSMWSFIEPQIEGDRHIFWKYLDRTSV